MGQKFGLVADGRRSTTQSLVVAGQDRSQTAAMALRLEADGEILAVFPNNSPQKATYTVKSCRGSLTGGQPATELLPTGTVIVATESDTGATTFTINGAAAGAEISSALDVVIELGSPRATDQEIFGPAGPVAVGSTWPVNGARLLAASPELTQEMGATGVTGTIKLVKITGTGANQVADIAGSFSLVGVKVPAPFSTKTAEFKADMTGSMPAGTTAGTMKQNMAVAMTLAGNATRPDGASMSMTVKVTSTLASDYTFR